MIEIHEQAKESGDEGLFQDKKRRPNLYRVALAIACMEKPEKVVYELTSIIKSSLNDACHGNEDFGLLFSDIFSSLDSTNNG